MPLTAKQVQHAKPGRHGDGKGLYLLVKPTGSKSWVLRVVVNGRRRDYGLGSVDLVTLSEARDKATEGRKLAKRGKDPSLHWKQEREVIPTFETAARNYYDRIKPGWRNQKHASSWLSSLETYAFPVIGARTVDQIEASDIREVLAPIWLAIPETARRVKQRCGSVLDFSHGEKWRATEAPMRAIAKGLPKQPKKSGQFAAMPYLDLPDFMADLREKPPTVGRLALEFAIIVAARSGEVRGADWREFDLQRREWTIPAERMKAEEAHTIPLPDAALAILDRMAEFAGGRREGLVFPGQKAQQPISENTMLKALRALGINPTAATTHGMRSAFKDWAREQCPAVPDDVSEAALSHTIPNAVKKAYQRTTFLEMRRGLMVTWANFLGGGTNALTLAAAE